jgi:hypothetical protein
VQRIVPGRTAKNKAHIYFYGPAADRFNEGGYKFIIFPLAAQMHKMLESICELPFQPHGKVFFDPTELATRHATPTLPELGI